MTYAIHGVKGVFVGCWGGENRMLLSLASDTGLVVAEGLAHGLAPRCCCVTRIPQTLLHPRAADYWRTSFF